MEYLVSGNEMAAMDQVTIEGLGVPGRALMEVAGRSVAAACKERVSEGDRVLIACGTGNNGGDGFVIARALADSGYDVSVTIFGNADDLKPDAASALIPVERTESISISFVADDSDLESFEDDLSEADLIVDALFGIGLHSDVRGHAAIAIDAINGSGAEIISVDIPSGVDSDSGVILGRAIDADTTVTFALPKRGHYIYPGAACKGELVVADIGIDPALADELEVEGRLLRAHDLEDLLWARSLDAHKGDFGHLVIAAGSPATPGAAILAIHGALRAGVGLVSWSADSATMGKGTAPAEVMLRERSGAAEDAAAKTLEGASALVVGPGMSQDETRLEELRALLKILEVPVCLDADALNLMSAHEDLSGLLKVPAVVTPHPREMARLLGCDIEEVQADRFSTAQEFAQQHNVVVVLKGAGTVVASPDGEVAVLESGSPALATGGTGDVLAGIIGALLAQGYEAFDAARAGVLLHALAGEEAARLHGESGVRAMDVVDAMGIVLLQHNR